jgi:cyclic nucleotide gated channel
MENDVIRNYNFDGIKTSKSTSRETGRFFKAKVLRKIFFEGFEKEKNKILDPRGQTISQWSKIYLFVDPLFLLLPIINNQVCVDNERKLEITHTIIRSVVELILTII